MVTLYRAAYQSEPRARNYSGTDEDEKPVDGVENGSWYTEINTGKKYRFDKENQVWIKQP